MAEIILKDFNLGGIANSDFQGLSNSVAKLVGFDIHSEGGVLKVNQKLTKESGTIIDDFVKCILPCSDGNTYLFGSTTGKIWQRTSGGSYSLAATAAPSSGSAGILDAIEDQGYIYYFMENKVGRWQIGTAWSTRNDDWATFSNGDSSFHPAHKVNLVVYIGDKHYIAQIRDGVFTGNALDLKTGLRVKSLGDIINELLIGTYVNDNVNDNEIFRWNTWAGSFSTQDKIPEVGINSFLKTDNFVIVSAGEKGNLYVYANDQLEQYLKIPGDYSNNKKATVYPNASVNFNGLPLFGVSNVNDDPVLEGVYSIGRTSRGYPFVLNLEYPISENVFSGVEIGAMAIVGDNLLVSWKRTGGGVYYGVDKLDWSAKYSSPYLETRVLKPDRAQPLEYSEVFVGYRSLPSGTDIKIYASVNFGSYTEIDSYNDANIKCIRTKVKITDASALQLKIAPQVSGNDAPEIDEIKIII